MDHGNAADTGMVPSHKVAENFEKRMIFLSDMHQSLRALLRFSFSPADDDDEKALGGTEESMCAWIFSKTTKSGEYEQDDVRLLTALHTGLASGAVVLDTADAVNAIGVLFRFGFWRMPQVVEWYCQRGELVEVIEAATQDHQQYLLRTFQEDRDYLSDAILFKVLRLYRFDVEHESNAGDDEQLPLEIRLHFAGFFDEVSEDEQLRERKGFRAGESSGDIAVDERERSFSEVDLMCIDQDLLQRGDEIPWTTVRDI